MDSISHVVLHHYQSVAMQTSQSWDALLAEPVARFLADANDATDKDLRKCLRDVERSADIVKDLAHNRQYIKRHLENGQLRADLLPFLIKFAPNPDDLLQDVCAVFGVLPVSAQHVLSDDLNPATSLEAIGKFNEHSGGLTALFSKMVASDGGLGPEDRPYVPGILKMADRVVSWANSIKFQAQQIVD